MISKIKKPRIPGINKLNDFLISKAKYTKSFEKNSWLGVTGKVMSTLLSSE